MANLVIEGDETSLNGLVDGFRGGDGSGLVSRVQFAGDVGDEDLTKFG
jgi:hypothetical protein